MSIKRLNTIYTNKVDQLIEICSLSLSLSENDLYFIDKSFDKFHISIHKDGNVFFTPQKDWKETKENILLFKFKWDLINSEIEKSKPFLFYIPITLDNYYIIEKPKSRTMSLYLNEINIEQLIFKYFIINEEAKTPKGRKSDLGITVNKIEGLKEDGTEILEENLKMNDPVFKFNNHKISLGFSKVNRDTKFHDRRFLFICQPDSNIDITKLLSENVFVIDEKKIENDGLYMVKYNYGGNDLVLLVY
jgi:hypothetical protein